MLFTTTLRRSRRRTAVAVAVAAAAAAAAALITTTSALFSVVFSLLSFPSPFLSAHLSIFLSVYLFQNFTRWLTKALSLSFSKSTVTIQCDFTQRPMRTNWYCVSTIQTTNDQVACKIFFWIKTSMVAQNLLSWQNSIAMLFSCNQPALSISSSWIILFSPSLNRTNLLVKPGWPLVTRSKAK